jgi:hypothetical protein
MKKIFVALTIVFLFVQGILLSGCKGNGAVPMPEKIVTELPTATGISLPTPTLTPQPTPTPYPPCYLSDLPVDIVTTYAIQGWQQFANQAELKLVYYYFPEDCSAEALERDGHEILYESSLPSDSVGLVILNPVDSGVLGLLYKHLVVHEYWQMGPEDYPALLDDGPATNKRLVFLRVNELNGDETIIGSPLTVMASLAEHEYIHVAQSRNNPDFAEMVWSDKDYQDFIEGYANIGNASSQRYYFETKAAIEILQNLDMMNRNGLLQAKIEQVLAGMDSSSEAFNASPPVVYDRHVRAFFLRVSSQAYLDALNEGTISPYVLFTRAGSGDILAYKVIREVLKSIPN